MIEAEAVAAAEDKALWARIRVDYERPDGPTQREIVAKYGVSLSALKWHIKRDLWKTRYRSKSVDRPLIIARLYRVLELQVKDLETGMQEMARTNARSGDREVAVLGKLAGNLEKLMQLDARAVEGKPRPERNRQMQDLRNKLAIRIEQLRRG